MAAVEEDRVAEHLSDIALGSLGEEISCLLALDQSVLPDPHFDELVILEGLIDSANDVVGDTFLAQLNYGGEVVP